MSIVDGSIKSENPKCVKTWRFWSKKDCKKKKKSLVMSRKRYALVETAYKGQMIYEVIFKESLGLIS